MNTRNHSVLLTYPSIVIFLGLVLRRSRWDGKLLLPLSVAYGGIVIAYLGEAHGRGSLRETALGVGLIFASACTYAVFILFAGQLLGFFLSLTGGLAISLMPTREKE